MIILGVETSCDETALSLIEATGGLEKPYFRVLASTLFSQAHLHAAYGGVFPTLAKREHGKNLIPLFRILTGKVGGEKPVALSEPQKKEIAEILAREPELRIAFLEAIESLPLPHIDCITVTTGPGLEPALWVGIGFARALSVAWGIPIQATNHMEGHILSPLRDSIEVRFPALALLISGGHTELISVKAWGQYTLLGQTRDDAIGEAFDKVARLLGLPYPGGPEISKLAALSRIRNQALDFSFPRPMIHSGDADFSFAGLKTAVLYHIQKAGVLTEEQKQDIAREFEDAVTEVLITKTKKILTSEEVYTLILGGGVIANTHIRKAFEILIGDFPNITLLTPTFDLATDNAIMIAMAGYIASFTQKSSTGNQILKAEGNLKL